VSDGVWQCLIEANRHTPFCALLTLNNPYTLNIKARIMCVPITILLEINGILSIYKANKKMDAEFSNLISGG
tara:strand:- start:351 stop:566 length:216 start_codon:yes stop_codon:yes gene_type:complete